LETPCINICEIDRAAGICIGCGRTGDEISSWIRLTPEQRQQVMDTLAARLDKLPPRLSPRRSQL